MITRIWSFKEAIDRLRFWGDWIVEYNDRTHLKSNTFVKLGEVKIQGSESAARELQTLPFIFEPSQRESLKQEVESKFPKGESGKKVNIDRAIEIIIQELTEHVVRSEMLPPMIQADDLEKLEDTNEPYLIAVADTGTLRRAIVSYLHIHLGGTKPVWTTIPTVSMIEIQQRAADIDSLVDKLRGSGPEPNNVGILRMRPSVTCSMWEIARLQASYPIDFISIEPSLLRQFPGLRPDDIRQGKMPAKNTLQDRLIIESIKNLKRERALEKGLYLVTTDRDMATFAQAENIHSIYADLPVLAEAVYSVRYNLYRKAFVVCPLQKFLWDLTAVFSKVRLIREDKSSQLELMYYQKHQQGYLDDRLEVVTNGPDFAPPSA